MKEICLGEIAVFDSRNEWAEILVVCGMCLGGKRKREKQKTQG